MCLYAHNNTPGCVYNVFNNPTYPEWYNTKTLSSLSPPLYHPFLVNFTQPGRGKMADLEIVLRHGCFITFTCV